MKYIPADQLPPHQKQCGVMLRNPNRCYQILKKLSQIGGYQWNGRQQIWIRLAPLSQHFSAGVTGIERQSASEATFSDHFELLHHCPGLTPETDG